MHNEGKCAPLGFYDRIRRGDAKREWKLPLMLAGTFFFLLLVAGTLLWACLYIQRYRSFVGQISDSTAYAYRNGGITVRISAEEYRLNGDRAYDIYCAVTDAGMGREVKTFPDTEADAVLLYGDGSSLSLWAVELQGEMTPHGREAPQSGLLLKYCGTDGREYCYDTPRLSPEWVLSVLRSAM